MVDDMAHGAPGDAELVEAIRAGDREAFAQLYDRYGPRIHAFCARVLGEPHLAADATQDTFVLAAQRLDQLRDPARVRAWLYAIARNECTRLGRARGRLVPVEELDVSAGADLDGAKAAGSGADAPADAAAAGEVAALLWAAADGLDERDRVLLELNVRHGLEGYELADAAGIPRGQIAMATGRMRERIERSLGALLVARKGRDDCPGLQAVLRDWDGTFSVLMRKRVARHVERCEVCEDRKRALVAPLGSLGVLPFALPPADLRDRVLAAVDRVLGGADPDLPGSHETWPDGFPPQAAERTPERPRWVGIAALVLTVVLAVGSIAWLAGGDDPVDDLAPAPAATTTTGGSGASPTEVEPGAATTSTFAGGGPIPTTPNGAPATTVPEVLAPQPGTNPTTSTTAAVVTIPGPTVTLVPPPPPPVTVAPNQPPTVGTTGRDQPGPLRTISCSESPKATVVSAAAGDDRGLASVVLRWTQAGGGSGQVAMTRSGSTWRATLGPFADGGDVAYRAVATDTNGATATSPAATVGVDPCPG